jgi:hypothetical protein
MCEFLLDSGWRGSEPFNIMKSVSRFSYDLVGLTDVTLSEHAVDRVFTHGNPLAPYA